MWKFKQRTKALLVSITLSGLMIANPGLAVETNNPNLEQLSQTLEYQQAADFTHLKWSETMTPSISIGLFPIINYSGQPINIPGGDSDDYYNGQLGSMMNSIFQDAFLASRYFVPVTHSPDYRLQLILDEYQLPYKVLPKNKTLEDYMKRNAPSSPESHIKLTAKLFSGQKKMPTWMKTIEVNFSRCELNTQPQPQTWQNNNNTLVKEYLLTSSGQAFLAATNYILLKAIQRINQKPLLAQIARKFGNDIHLSGHSNAFTRGEKLEVFRQHESQGKSVESLGKIQIIKAKHNHALAYPISLRADHLLPGDWVELNRKLTLGKPDSAFIAQNSCGDRFMIKDNLAENEQTLSADNQLSD